MSLLSWFRGGRPDSGDDQLTRVLSPVALAVALGFVAMLRYPGGTPLDRSAAGYSPTRNFLSDLGMTVAYDGRANRLGALLFALSLLLLIVALGGGAFRIIRRYAAAPRSRRLARAAAFFAVLACMAFAGVAMTPENRVMSLHIDATFLAWRVFAVASVLLWIASLQVDADRRRVTVAWGALALALGAYEIILELGPPPTTLDGLRVQVIAQKAIAVIAVAVLSYLSVEASRRRSNERSP